MAFAAQPVQFKLAQPTEVGQYGGQEAVAGGGRHNQQGAVAGRPQAGPSGFLQLQRNTGFEDLRSVLKLFAEPARRWRAGQAAVLDDQACTGVELEQARFPGVKAQAADGGNGGWHRGDSWR
ncbi:MAG: hypothetical protein JSR83_24335 [Proteobacteria bacterium]|nr:hypothetical protein [Pseudomonadota bacterium]